MVSAVMAGVVRDFIPAGSELTDAEKQRLQFSRDPGTPQPQAVGIKADPVGSAQAQTEEAMRLVKERTAKEHAEEQQNFLDKVSHMEKLSVPEAVAFLQRDGMSQFEREAYLRAEIAGKNRTTLKQFFGWS